MDSCAAEDAEKRVAAPQVQADGDGKGGERGRGAGLREGEIAQAVGGG